MYEIQVSIPRFGSEQLWNKPAPPLLAECHTG